MSMRLLSLNIQNRNNIDRVTAFLKAHTFDVVMLQEVFHDYVPMFEELLQMKSVFAPHVTKDDIPWGVAAFIQNPQAKPIIDYYVGTQETVHPFDNNAHHIQNKALVGFSFQNDDIEYCLLSTHFTSSPMGRPSDFQRVDLDAMLKVLDTYDNFVLCGDFNAPRGTEIFTKIAEKYRDNIPPDVVSTLDPELHKAKGINYVVDGIFSTSHYAVTNVEVFNGVSDHCAITADINRLS